MKRRGVRWPTDIGPVMVAVASIIGVAFVLRVGWQWGKVLSGVLHG